MALAPIAPQQPHALPGLEPAIQAHLDGVASEAEVALLQINKAQWIETLYRLLDDADAAIDDASRSLRGPERALVVNDLESEATRIDAVLTELVGPPSAQPESRNNGGNDNNRQRVEVGTTQLQLSWLPGRVIAFAGGHNAATADADVVLERLVAAGANAEDWEPFQAVKLPSGNSAPSLVAPMEAVAGWLITLSGTTTSEFAKGTADDSDEDDNGPEDNGTEDGTEDSADDEAENDEEETTAEDETDSDQSIDELLGDTGVSVRWMGLAASLSVRLVAQGRMVPQLRKSRKSPNESGRGDGAAFCVRWEPALIDQSELVALSSSLPHAVTALGHRQDARSATINIVGDIINAIATAAAERLETPAASPTPKNKTEIAEAVIANLDGEPFSAPNRTGNEVVRRLEQWARPVSGPLKFSLIAVLDPPDDSQAWYLKVLAPTSDGGVEPVEAGLVTASNSRRKEIRDQLTRLERLYPPLLRPGAQRRGEVVLSQDEAWQLMSVQGQVLRAAGFDIRVPSLSLKKATPSLRLTSEADDSVVGAQQLANVRWSAVFDDVELTADEIAELASQARPLVNSNGRWIELDRVDLVQAAAALAERADQTKLSGADMLRHALGLEGSPLAGGIAISGTGWAADLLRGARDIPEDLPLTPEGFSGELRSYQANALAWLGFLDSAGLGGCLALDMGLGKTPTMLAHIGLTKDTGPTLVIAPPAVVGNWAAEAKRFVGGVRVTVHHGANRAEAIDIPRMVDRSDLVITTYGTAVRDVDDLSKISWGKVVLDEAQAIKNPASETAQQLRRFDARSRIALTGTPIENGLGDLWAILDWANPGLVGNRSAFISQLSATNADRTAAAESALMALNGILVFRRTKAEPAIAAELPDRIDELDHCAMTAEQIGLYQAVLDKLVVETTEGDDTPRQKGAVLAAITALKQICNHPVNYREDDKGLDGRSGKLARVNEIVDTVFAANEKVLIFTHFASWGEKLAGYLSERTGKKITCYHGGLARGARDRMVDEFQKSDGAGALVLSLKAGGTGLNLTAANHVVLYDRWWNPAVEDQARDRVWRIGQEKTVVCHRLVCPGTVDERVEEVVAGKRQIADLVLPKSSSVEDLDASQIQAALGIDADALIADEEEVLA